MSEFEDKLVNGLKEFADCAHEHLKCEKCGARSDIRGWQTFTGQDKDMLELRDEIDRLTARLAAAEAEREQYRMLAVSYGKTLRVSEASVDSIVTARLAQKRAAKGGNHETK